MVSSKPSRRMISASTANCSSPRPCTSQVSGRSVSSTRRDTLPRISWSSRSLIMRAVSLEPSRRRAGWCWCQRHRDRRLVHHDQRQRTGIVGVGDRLADRDLIDTGHGDDVAGTGAPRGRPLQPLGHQQLGQLDPGDGAVAATPGHRLAPAATVPCAHAAEREPAEVRRGVQVGDLRLHGRPGTCVGAGMWVRIRSSSGLSCRLGAPCSSVAMPARALL